MLDWGFPMQSPFCLLLMPFRTVPSDLHTKPCFPEVLGGIDTTVCVWLPAPKRVILTRRSRAASQGSFLQATPPCPNDLIHFVSSLPAPATLAHLPCHRGLGVCSSEPLLLMGVSARIPILSTPLEVLN